MKRALKPAMIALLLLAGCISGRPPQDTYTSETTGKTTVIQSDREMCESSCNNNDDRCMDTEPANNNLPGEMSGMFGASAQCRDDLASCLKSCKTR